MRGALVLLLLVLLSPGTATAATVSIVPAGADTGTRGGVVSLDRLVLSAEPGEANRIDVTALVDDEIEVSDAGAPLEPGAGCRTEGLSVRCRHRGELIDSRIELGDGDDVLVLSGPGFRVDGGAGDDHLKLLDGVATFDGGPGADRMEAAAGKTATVDYSQREGALAVTIGDGANDGEPGEGDDVGPGIISVRGGRGDDAIAAGQDLSALSGGPGDDRLIGGPARDGLSGGAGDDVVSGGPGDDSFSDETGADLIRGGDGRDTMSYANHGPNARGVDVTLDDRPGDGDPGENDDVGADVEVVQGGAGDDRLTGGPGAQELDGALGADLVSGGAGDDRLIASGSFGDRVAGGPGRDELVVAGNTTVDTADGEPDRIRCMGRLTGRLRTDPLDAGGRDCAPGISLRSGPLRASRTGRVAVELRCQSVLVRCTGTLTLASDRSGATLARVALDLRPDRVRTVHPRLRRSARARLLRSPDGLDARVVLVSRRRELRGARTSTDALRPLTRGRLLPGR